MSMLGDIFRFERVDIYLLILGGIVIALALNDKVPSVETIRKFIAAFDDRGGVILLLAAFSAWFFATSIKLFYYAINLHAEAKISKDDAVVMMALTWATGSAFGLGFGALLKTLTGAQTVAPPFPSTDLQGAGAPPKQPVAGT